MEQINGANLLAFCSLAQQAADSAITTRGNMDAVVKHYVALQTENVKLREQCQYMTLQECADAEYQQEPVKDEPVAWMWKFKGDDGAAFPLSVLTQMLGVE